MSINIKELIVDKRVINKISSSIKKYKSPVLLVGKSGIGKTTLILSVAKYLKYKIVNINPDSNYKNNTKNLFIKKQIVLIDNLEEIKGKKLTEIITHFIKDSRPLFLITSEVHKDLANIKRKFKIRATNYTFSQSEWLEYLVKKYTKQNRKYIKKLVKNFEYNKAMTVNQLNIELNSNIEFKKTLTDFEIRENIFNKNFNRNNLFFRDPFLYLSIFDNYPKLKKNNIEYCNNTLSALCIIDVMETELKHTQNYSLKPYIDIFVTDMATWDYNEKLGFAGFPQYFTKTKLKPLGKRNLLLENQLMSNKKIKKLKK